MADGGAHLGTICDASFPTTLLTLWARDRDRGRLDLPFAVQRHTSATARTVGLLDRGVLAPGYRADVNVIDFERLTARRPEMFHDLPAGGKRLVQAADGYVATLVAGEVTYENGETRGPLPGRLVRGPQAAPATGATTIGNYWSNAMNASDLTPLETGCEWRARRARPTRTCSSSPTQHLEELDSALAHAEAASDDVLDITRESFPLPTLGTELAGITRDLINGRGVALIRGVPVDRYGKERASSIYWGIGMHLGNPWPQNAKGHLLGDVTDQGKAANDPTSRGNEIGGIAFPFHSDGSDLVGLFCLDAGAQWRRERGGQCRHDPQRAGAHRARARRRAVRARSRTTSGARTRRARSRGTRCRSSTGSVTGSSCATSARTSRRRAVTTTRPGHRRPRVRR